MRVLHRYQRIAIVAQHERTRIILELAELFTRLVYFFSDSGVRIESARPLIQMYRIEILNVEQENSVPRRPVDRRGG